MSRKYHRADATIDPHEAQPLEPTPPAVLVKLHGVALIDHKFVQVTATIPVGECTKVGAPGVYMEYIYAALQRTVEDEGLDRSADRYREVTR